MSVDGATVVLHPLGRGEVPHGSLDTHHGSPDTQGAGRQRQPENLLNALDDPATFGGVLPGYAIPVSAPEAVE